MTTRYFTNKENEFAISSDPDLAYVSMENGTWIGHRIDGSAIDLPLTTLVEVCQAVIDETWIELTEPPKTGAPVKKAQRQTIFEAARNLKQAYQDIKLCLEHGNIPYFNDPGFNAAEDAWCRIEEFEQLMNELSTPFFDWSGHAHYPDGVYPDSSVEVNLWNGAIRVGFAKEFEWEWQDSNKPKDGEIVSYRLIDDILAQELTG